MVSSEHRMKRWTCDGGWGWRAGGKWIRECAHLICTQPCCVVIRRWRQDADEEDGVGTESDSDGEFGYAASAGRQRRRRQNVRQAQWMRLRSHDDDDVDHLTTWPLDHDVSDASDDQLTTMTMTVTIWSRLQRRRRWPFDHDDDDHLTMMTMTVTIWSRLRRQWPFDHKDDVDVDDNLTTMTMTMTTMSTLKHRQPTVTNNQTPPTSQVHRHRGLPTPPVQTTRRVSSRRRLQRPRTPSSSQPRRRADWTSRTARSASVTLRPASPAANFLPVTSRRRPANADWLCQSQRRRQTGPRCIISSPSSAVGEATTMLMSL